MSEGPGPLGVPHTKQRINEALTIIKAFGLPRGQQNERSALTLLALLDVQPNSAWRMATNPLRGITPMMAFFEQYYGRKYAPNTRETVRRFTVHQFLQAGLVVPNPDDLSRPVNSPRAVYQVESSALSVIRTFGTPDWEVSLGRYLASVGSLTDRYARERDMRKIPIRLSENTTIHLTPGGQNELVDQIVNEFCPRFTPGGVVIYVGDTGDKFAYFDEALLRSLGVEI
jgi:hypothetical protein